MRPSPVTKWREISRSAISVSRITLLSTCITSWRRPRKRLRQRSTNSSYMRRSWARHVKNKEQCQRIRNRDRQDNLRHTDNRNKEEICQHSALAKERDQSRNRRDFLASLTTFCLQTRNSSSSSWRCRQRVRPRVAECLLEACKMQFIANLACRAVGSTTLGRARLTYWHQRILRTTGHLLEWVPSRWIDSAPMPHTINRRPSNLNVPLDLRPSSSPPTI